MKTEDYIKSAQWWEVADADLESKWFIGIPLIGRGIANFLLRKRILKKIQGVKDRTEQIGYRRADI